jgi:uncharacterized membrane protein YbhN (UPF0104 family)
MKSPVKRIAKAIIAMIVVIGLALATRGAVDQWNQQRDAAQQRVAEINRLIETETSVDQRRRLEVRLNSARAEVPSFENLRWSKIGLAGLLYAMSLIPGGIVLYEATRAVGYRVPVGEAVSAQIVGHLGKYVPGKAMVVVIRAGRLASAGVPVLAGSISVFLETFLMMAVGAAIAGCLIFQLPVPRWIAWTALIFGIVATLPTLPPIMTWVVQRVSRHKGIATESAEEPLRGTETLPVGVSETESRATGAPPGTPASGDWRFFVSAWGWQLVAWVLIGTSFFCLVDSIPGGSNPFSASTVFAASLASIALAMVVGFASLLPGGAGIRELTTAVVLAPVVGPSQALLAAILARLLFIVVELLAVLAVTAVQRVR